MESLPVVPKDLLEALEDRFPERCPDPSWSDREIWMRVGARQVIRFLRLEFESQNENVMRDTHVY